MVSDVKTPGRKDYGPQQIEREKEFIVQQSSFQKGTLHTVSMR
jgi:hypothetical protein